MIQYPCHPQILYRRMSCLALSDMLLLLDVWLSRNGWGARGGGYGSGSGFFLACENIVGEGSMIGSMGCLRVCLFF